MVSARAGKFRQAATDETKGAGMEQPHTLRIGDRDFDLRGVSDEQRAKVERLNFAEVELQRLNNLKALLTRAKNGYIEDLKREVLRERTGYDLGDLMADD